MTRSPTARNADEDGNLISEFYNLNLELIEKNKKTGKICMNPECVGAYGLKDGERPMISLGKRCWSCKDNKYLTQIVKE